MISTTLSGATTLYNYNGDDVRLRQVVAGTPTTYTQDLAAPLPVVLRAKTGATTSKYLYSIGTRPIGQYTSAWEYLLPDALGSVRQIVDANGNVTLAESYEPYGTVLTSTGTASSIFAYAGEQIDTYIKLVFLRSRYYSPETGGFLSKDMWQGDYTRPQTLNGWGYVEGNPINRVDPTGKYAWLTEEEASAITMLSPFFFDSASRHNMAGSNMSDGVFASLLVALMRNDDAFNRFKSDPALQRTARFWKYLDPIGMLITDKGLGPGNIQESTLYEILHNRVRRTSIWEEQNGPREYFDFCMDYNLRFKEPLNTQSEWAALFGVPMEVDYGLYLASTQNLEMAIDLGGAVIQEGIMRMKLQNEQPYVFNLMMWWMQGVTTDFEINEQEADHRGQARDYGEKVLPEAIDILKQSLPLLALVADGLQRVGMKPVFAPMQSYDFSYELGPSYERYVKWKERGGQ